MATTRRKAKGRSGASRFAGIPHNVMESESYTLLDGWAVKLLLEMAKQYNGHNNGDLSATWKVMQGRGFRSNGTLSDALKQLEQAGMIEKTRQGGRNRCSLYALTWAPIHECKGKLELRPTTTPSNKWKQSIDSGG